MPEESILKAENFRSPRKEIVDIDIHTVTESRSLKE